MPAVASRFRDVIRKYLPPWLSDRRDQSVTAPDGGKTVGFRYVWSMISPLDAALEVAVEGLRAALLGIGTSTALPYISRTRGLIRGEDETDEEFTAYLRTWLDKWRAAGSAEAIADAIQHYLANHPKIRIVTRSGYWITLDTDGTITRQQGAWDWDSVSHPERAGYWSEIWIIVYPTEWAQRDELIGEDGVTFAGDTLGVGHDVGRVAYDAIQGLVAQWKAAHTKVRAIIWTSDAALFDPDDEDTLPDGTWGAWGFNDGGSYVLGGRNLETCRYWEPK